MNRWLCCCGNSKFRFFKFFQKFNCLFPLVYVQIVSFLSNPTQHSLVAALEKVYEIVTVYRYRTVCVALCDVWSNPIHHSGMRKAIIIFHCFEGTFIIFQKKHWGGKKWAPETAKKIKINGMVTSDQKRRFNKCIMMGKERLHR